MTRPSSLTPGVAAGHPQTAQVGAQILRSGGSATDAAVAMALAGCAVETLFTGLAGGGFATHYDAATGQVSCHDFFVAVPGLDGTPAGQGQDIKVAFNGVSMPYRVGGPTVAVPGTPTGLANLHELHGRLSWGQVVTPAVRLAESGAPFPASHAGLLPDIASAMLLGDGAAAFSVIGADGARSLLGTGGRLFHGGLADTMRRYRESGPDALMAGEFAERLVEAVQVSGGNLSLLDLSRYRPTVRTPRTVELGEQHSLHLRGDDLDDVAGTFLHYRQTAGAVDDPVDRARRLVAALHGPAKRSDTSSLVAVDADGNACALTHSLGLGSGVWVDGVHGNSMVGEGELVRGPLIPGERMGSMMSPLIVTGSDGELVLAAGAAGGGRIRAALLQVVSLVIDSGLSAVAAVEHPRLAVAGAAVHLEPGFPPEVAAGLTADGWQVITWPEFRPFFGGAALAGVTGIAADPRRSGQAITVSV